MPTSHGTPSLNIASLPDSALLHVFQLFCGSCAPEAPGPVRLAPVCKRWRRRASQVKGLRVVFQGDQLYQVASFRAWLRRYAGQVKTLAIASSKGVQVLRALTAAAAIAAGAEGESLPLQRLVVVCGQLWDSEVCQDVLHPLLVTLPHLNHLHLPFAAPDSNADWTAAAEALIPLQHSTTLTSLVLEGFNPPSSPAAGIYGQLLARLPATLRSLIWRLHGLERGEELAFGHLPGLTHLSLTARYSADGSVPADAFSGLHHLRKLELYVGDGAGDETLLAVKEQLVGLEPGDDIEVLDQLTHLQSLRVSWTNDVPALLQQAPPLQRLHMHMSEYDPMSLFDWSTPWALQHYSRASSLQGLSLYVVAPQAAPLGLCGLKQLKQLHLTIESMNTMDTSHVTSWACVLAGLVNLEVLTVPALLTACRHPWLKELPRLVVLEVGSAQVATDVASAASHISLLLAADTGTSSGGGAGGSSSSRAGGPLQAELVRVVCFDGSRDPQQTAQLHQAVAAAVPVLPPNKHLFRGTWQLLQDCGLELWPAPVAARLQQLQLD